MSFLFIHTEQSKHRFIKSGFTLVEVLISLTVFSVVVVIAVGALLALVDANRKAQRLQSVMDNVTFALDNMSRNIATGSNFWCRNGSSINLSNVSNTGSGDKDCYWGGRDGLVLTSDTGQRISYRFVPAGGGNPGRIERLIGGPSGHNWLPFTAPEVQIDDLRFYVRGTFPNTDNEQPVVVIVVKGSGGQGEAGTEFSIQTTVTQRILDE